ncbi:uncharacterized protein FSUBG_2867 [Fusarium subglutinans]|uniref:Uncharacterized protein n=1 Tax=Gibberella subglutinans TaxID=42677 RepID=A0A8H5V4R9_GIBSU|nr:uncharacterized protein FSUBG_2867 [Fusarium subglutinans]KAF5610606.1 hypothetical protein FSUBG_2867 [Fusarium subglutinans]
MDAGKRSRQADVEEDDDTDSDVPLRETQAKRLKRFHEPNPARAISPPPPQPSQPASSAQAQPETQPSITAIRPERSQCRVQPPRPRAQAPSVRTQLPATAAINSARQASQSSNAVSEPFRPAATRTANTLPIDGNDSNPRQSRWPPLPDNNDIPHAFLFYAEEIRIVVNMLCGTRIDREPFFDLIRHKHTDPSARPVWNIPEISEQKEIGFLCGKSPAHHHSHV